jgi:hypothetical protein
MTVVDSSCCHVDDMPVFWNQQLPSALAAVSRWSFGRGCEISHGDHLHAVAQNGV